MYEENRYQRQLQLAGFGNKAQQKLAKAKVLVIGAGGLGCPALQYLVGAGVGIIGILDFDRISISNLHRQTLYATEDVGKSKVEVAAKKLNALNPEIEIRTYFTMLTNKNALDIIVDYDIVIDGTDNFSTRYVINDACVLLHKPLIYGAVLRFEGQVSVFNFEINNTKTNYRDLFPLPPETPIAISCNEVGILGVLPGMIGIWQASEAIKIITNIGTPLANKIMIINLLENTFYEVLLKNNPKNNSQIPLNKDSFLKFNYDLFCNKNAQYLVSIETFDKLRNDENCRIIDVREVGETPVITKFKTEQLPLSKMSKNDFEKENSNTIILFCQSGQRSLTALEIIKKQHPLLQVFSLEGGIIKWKIYHNLETI